ncbi:MAG: hypothetical protein JRI55_23355 [Deltaproteobacteria bacterium]|nr:hypothetical protein [Deltaproteobacteria bacterium]
MLTRAVRPLALLSLLVAGCGDEGRLLITIERPNVKAFDPMMDERLSRFSLRVIQGRSQSDQETVRTEQTQLELGSVPVDKDFDLRLVGKSGTGQMLGLGVVFDVNISGEGDVPVAVKFRKPIGFVAGSHGIEQLDATASTDSAIHSEKPIAAPNAADVAASPDGTWIAVVSGSKLLSYLTRDRHNWADVQLKAPGTCIAVSPDSRYAVVCHDDGSVSIVDMERLAENQLEIRPVGLGGKPGRVVFGRDRELAHVLVNRAGHKEGCSAQSRVVELNVRTAAKGRDVAVGEPVADIAIDPRDGRVLLVQPCKSRLARLDGTAVQQALGLPSGVHDLALTDQYMVLMRTVTRQIPLDPTDPTSEKRTRLDGEAVLVDLNKGTFAAQKKSFLLPLLAVSLTTANDEGAMFWAQETQDFTIYDLTVSPDGQRALFLFDATYSSNTSLAGCSLQATMTAEGLVLVDLTVDSVIYWQMASIEISKCSLCGQDCRLTMQEALQRGLLLSTPQYTPRGAAMLFGGN